MSVPETTICNNVMHTKLVSHDGTKLGAVMPIETQILNPKPQSCKFSRFDCSCVFCDVCRELKRMPLKLAQLGRHLLLVAARLWLGMQCHIHCPFPQVPQSDLSSSTGAAAAACLDATTWRLSCMD